MTRRLILHFLASAVSWSFFGCAPRRRIACVGDSITSGTGLRRPYFESYPARLQRALPLMTSVQNLGVPGATVSREGDVALWTSGKLEEVAARRPDVVVLLMGSNDSKPQNWRGAPAFEASLRELTTQLTAHTATSRIVLASPPPAWANAYQISATVVADEIVPAIERRARQLGSPYVDLWALFREKKELFPDGVHPDARGAAAIAAAVHPAVVAILAPATSERGRSGSVSSPTTPG